MFAARTLFAFTTCGSIDSSSCQVPLGIFQQRYVSLVNFLPQILTMHARRPCRHDHPPDRPGNGGDRGRMARRGPVLHDWLRGLIEKPVTLLTTSGRAPPSRSSSAAATASAWGRALPIGHGSCPAGPRTRPGTTSRPRRSLPYSSTGWARRPHPDRASRRRPSQTGWRSTAAGWGSATSRPAASGTSRVSRPRRTWCLASSAPPRPSGGSGAERTA